MLYRSITMVKSTRSRKSKKPAKPEKPYPNFPLFPHATKRWAKKIKGQLWYFGSWADGPQAAMDRYLAERDAIFAGRDPRVPKVEGYTLGMLCNEFLNAKQAKLTQGKMRTAHFADLHKVCKRLIDFFGAGRLVKDIGPDDFERLDHSYPSTWKLRRRKREIGGTRSVFLYALKKEKIERVRFGPFAVPTKDQLKAERFANERKHGNRLFSAEQLRTILDAATAPLKALVYLGLNCGLGNTDLSELTTAYIDLENRWLDFPRIKTSVQRRSYLWTETVEAVREAMKLRASPENPDDANLVFVTKTGLRMVRVELSKDDTGKVIVNNEDTISKAFAALLAKLKFKRRGLSFYSLRHHVETYGGADQPALNVVMGHEDGSMAANYRGGISDDRLRAVSASIYSWLFGRPLQ
jgi:integrase